jgi:Flp pilus assembly protein TadG
MKRKRRGQALVEMAMIVPLLALLMLGAADLARAFHREISLTGASRVGMRVGVLDTATDIGAAVRGEPAIANTTATWGATGPGGLNDCDPTQPAHRCGDANGCAPTSFVGNQVACFAVQACTLSGSVCTATPPNWGSRPASGSSMGLQVRVVYRFAAVTPLIGLFTSGGVIYLTSDTFSLQQY